MVRIIDTRYMDDRIRQGLSGWSGSEISGCEDLLETLEVEIPQLKAVKVVTTKTEDHVTPTKPVKGSKGPGRPKTKVPISEEKKNQILAKIAKAVEARRKRK